jgi:IS1 family transposase
MTSWLLFPPNTREVQLDEKWSFVGKKEKNCSGEPACGDNWDHVAFDPEHRLVLKVVNGKRSHLHVRAVLQAVDRIMEGRLPRLVTSDEFSAYYEELLLLYGVLIQPERRGNRGKLPRPRLEPPEELLYATVHKTREHGTVVKVEPRLQFGTEEQLSEALAASKCSDAVNTSFIERHNGTDRNQNKRKARKTYCFSKDWEVHNAMTKFTMYSYNFCWPVRTLRVKSGEGCFEQRTPAMAAGLTDHIWSIEEWSRYPVPI